MLSVSGVCIVPPAWSHHATTQRFIFATGIECSYPSIETAQGRRLIDQLEKCGHYTYWHQDLELCRELGMRYLRYGSPYYKTHLGPGKYDWSFLDLVLPAIQRLGIIPIIDLCHVGVPDWLGNFQNPDFPHYFAAYARAFAERYPWVFCYTPVNEMYIAAHFSAYLGWWNERLTSHQDFATALKHLARPCLEAILAIIQVKRDAVFVLCESSEHTPARAPELVDEAAMHNAVRFLSLDLVCGWHVHAGMFTYLLEHGWSEHEYLRPVGRAYRELIRAWRATPLLPNGPLTVIGAWAGPFEAEAGDGPVLARPTPAR